MDYREYPVPAALRAHVHCVWRLHDPAPARDPQTIYPDGCCELIVHLAAPMRALGAQGWHVQAPTLFAAQQRTAVRLAAQDSVHCIGVRLRPAASAAVAARALPALRDRIVDLATLDADFSAALRSAAAGTNADSVDALWPLLETRLLPFAIDPRIDDATAALASDDGRGMVRPLAARVGMGQRAFQTRFLEQVGLGPKEFARVRRLHAMLHLLDAEHATVAQAAHDGGFADQAHATRELRRITGITPRALLQALRRDRSADHAVRLALAFVRGRSAHA